jgi:hypothetical protein
MGPMRFWSAVLLSACLVSTVSCVRRAPRIHYQQLTGTCDGACEYYLACKQYGGDPVSEPMHHACVSECGEVFSSRDSIMAFESLTCEDAVGFVEGSSGRAPGERAAAESTSHR